MEQQSKRLYKNFCVFGAMLICLLLALPTLRLIPAGAQPQTLSDVNREHDLDLKIRTFFDTMSKGNSASAFEELLRASPYEAASASIELRTKVEELPAQFGGIVNYEKYDTQRIGADVIVLRYIVKYEHYPVAWSFTFYRKPAFSSGLSSSNNAWGLIEVHFDTNIRRFL